MRTGQVFLLVPLIALAQDKTEPRPKAPEPKPIVSQISESALKKLQECIEREDWSRLVAVHENNLKDTGSFVPIAPQTWLGYREYFNEWLSTQSAQVQDRVRERQRYVRADRKASMAEREERISSYFFADGADIEADRLANELLEQGELIRAARLWWNLLRLRRELQVDRAAIAAKLFHAAQLLRSPQLAKAVSDLGIDGTVTVNDKALSLKELIAQAPTLHDDRAFHRLHDMAFAACTFPSSWGGPVVIPSRFVDQGRTLFAVNLRTELSLQASLPGFADSGKAVKSDKPGPILGCEIRSESVWANIDNGKLSTVARYRKTNLSRPIVTIDTRAFHDCECGVSYFSSPPVLDGEQLYVAGTHHDDPQSNDTYIVCLDADSCGVKWCTFLEDGPATSVRVLTADGIVVAITSRSQIAGFERSTGRPLFLKTIPQFPGTPEAVCLAFIDGGRLFIPVYEEKQVIAFDLVTLESAPIGNDEAAASTWSLYKAIRLYSIAQRGDKSALSQLLDQTPTLLKDRDADIRKFALDLLMLDPNPRGREELAQEAIGGKDDMVRSLAAAQLWISGDPRGRPTLEQALTGSNPASRLLAVVALSTCEDPKVLQNVRVASKSLAERIPEAPLIDWMLDPESAQTLDEAQWRSVPETLKPARLLFCPALPEFARDWLKKYLKLQQGVSPEVQTYLTRWMLRAGSFSEEEFAAAASQPTTEEARALIAFGRGCASDKSVLDRINARSSEELWGAAHALLWMHRPTSASIWATPAPEGACMRGIGIREALTELERALNIEFEIGNVDETQLTGNMPAPPVTLQREFSERLQKIWVTFGSGAIDSQYASWLPKGAHDSLAIQGAKKRLDELWRRLTTRVSSAYAQLKCRLTVGDILMAISASRNWEIGFLHCPDTKRVRIMKLESIIKAAR